jgi:hypothetical protein
MYHQEACFFSKSRYTYQLYYGRNLGCGLDVPASSQVVQIDVMATDSCFNPANSLSTYDHDGGSQGGCPTAQYVGHTGFSLYRILINQVWYTDFYWRPSDTYCTYVEAWSAAVAASGLTWEPAATYPYVQDSGNAAPWGNRQCPTAQIAC